MPKTKLIFESSDLSKYNSEMECYTNDNRELFINIYTEGNEEFIVLDRDTAIKLSKHIKTEINKMNS